MATGSELAGVVESVGQSVRNFRAGDPVFAFSDVGTGCHAEYKCMPHNGRVPPKPECLSYDEAAALSFGGATAVDFLHKGKVRLGASIRR
jgi:NADPH:quinone reductase-like Zn-dependent oxidoreductase